MKNMNCVLCKKPILNYHHSLHHLKIEEGIEVDICSGCIDKFMKWQQGILAKLFPTKSMKNMFKKN